ncbi:2'-5' RNA ligase family protein [Pseudoxanthomonas mexicana]|uniref:2'-5' RNA ligase family protein n=1 Tax=Pseudoxanthomonas mexicana TaxID=128785 RepID=UPI00398ABB91
MNPQEQLFRMPAEPLHRLFFAWLPAQDERRRLAALAQELRARMPAVRWVDPRRHHMTLLYLGESPGPRESWIRMAREAGRRLRADAFALAPDRIAAFGNPRQPALALTCAQVPPAAAALGAALREAAARAGFTGLAGPPLHPHVTLGYARGPATVDEAVAAVPLEVRGFHLLHGIAGAPDYQCLGEWRLS